MSVVDAMREIFEELRNAGREVDTVEMSRLIIHIFDTKGADDPKFHPLREILQRHGPELLNLGLRIDTEAMGKIISCFCKMLFRIRHGEREMQEFNTVLSSLQIASRDVDTELMVQAIERLLFLCESSSPGESQEEAARKIETARQRVVTSVRDSGWSEIANSLSELLWSLSEVRPDFEELPSWIAEAKSRGVFESPEDKGVALTETVFTLLRSTVNRYGTGADRALVSRMKSTFVGKRHGVQSDELAVFSADLAVQLAGARAGCRRLPLAIDEDQLLFGRHTRVSFNRTLRVPEDGKKYPLPAGFGRLPILKVEDYAGRVPEQWLEQGGFIIPLYQREALFLEFSGVEWRPAIGKVSVGRINAITGKQHDLKLRPHRQDYVVIPEQRWLDGINSGDGTVSQFVAMPLGRGYTVEAQLTDEEQHGGFQIAVFEPRKGRFPECDPQKEKAASDERKARRFRAEQDELLSSLPQFERNLIRLLQTERIEDAAKRLQQTVDQVRAVVHDIRMRFERALGENGFDGIIPDLHDMAPDILRSKAPRFSSEGEYGTGLYAAVPESVEMGIAAGGSIEQQIIEDTYGVESWDETSYRDITIHIVNSEMYERMTGLKAPETPISEDDYREYGIPWFSDYQEEATTLAPAAAFKHLRSVAQIDMNRRVSGEEFRSNTFVQPGTILRIRTPTFDERFLALVERSEHSLQAGRHSISIREASLALDMIRGEDDFLDARFAPLLVRARAQLLLGNNSDAEADASECLKLRFDSRDALGIRSMASLNMGEHLLARRDAEKVLESDPDSEEALFVIKQSGFLLPNRSQAARCIPEIQQVSIPQEKEEECLSAAKALIDEGNRTPEALAALLLELGDSTGRDLRKYAQAMWDRFGLVDPALRGTHDWAKIFAGVLCAPSSTRSRHTR